MGNYLQISIPTLDVQQAERLIAELSDCGFEGFEEEEHCLLAYIQEADFKTEDLDLILIPAQLGATIIRIEPVNWNQAWENSFQPVRIEDFCEIRAGFHPSDGTSKYNIVITPKMSFGTGHHASTYMMVLAMKDLAFKGKRVLDFGTGTGILAILAEKAGAQEILALDMDDYSIDNAVENLSENHCHAIRVEKRDSFDQTGFFDIILANLNKNSILANMGSFRQHLRANGVLLLSGLLQEDGQELESAALENKLSITAKMIRENWICLRLENTDSKEV
jgi:ribosomal protein L11 methyltransferase